MRVWTVRSLSAQWRTSQFLDDAAYIGKQPVRHFGRQIRRTMLGEEDDVRKQVDEAVRHGSYAPFRGWSLVGPVPTTDVVGYFLSPCGLS